MGVINVSPGRWVLRGQAKTAHQGTGDMEMEKKGKKREKEGPAGHYEVHYAVFQMHRSS